MPEFTTILKDLDLMMRLGIHPHEVAPQRVRVSVWLTVVYSEPLGADAINEVLDYDFVRAELHAMAAGPGFALQEAFCEAAAALCFRDQRVRLVRVRSMKPDVYPDAAVGCEIVRVR